MIDLALWSAIAAERFDLAGWFLVEVLTLTSSTRQSDPDRIIGSRDIAFSVFPEYLRNGRTGDIKLFFKRWENMSSIQRWSNRPDRLNGLAVVITLKELVCFRLKCISSAILDFFSAKVSVWRPFGGVSIGVLGVSIQTPDPEKIRIWTQNYFFDILAMAGATDGILKLK